MNQEQFSARKLNNSLTHRLDDEVVIYDSEQTRCHVLNPAAAAVWERCSTTANIDELSAALSSRTDLPADPEVAYLALEELKSANLLAGNPSIPASTGGLSRRKMLVRLGFTAALLPVVTSVLAPRPAMAASGAPGGGTGGPGGGTG